MAIIGFEKVKVQKIITAIESSSFDVNDVDNLFMKLRAHSTGFPIFREIADFIAHNDLRDVGITQKAIESFYLRIRFFAEYISIKKKLDLSKPFPAYIINLMKYQIDDASDILLKENYNLTKESFVKLLDTAFQINKFKEIELKKFDALKRLIPAVQYIMSYMVVRTAFNHYDIIKELNGVLKLNQIQFNKDLFNQNNDKILICILGLLNGTKFKVGPKKYGYCQICFDNPIDNSEHKEIEMPVVSNIGYLGLEAKIEVNVDGKNIFFAFMIFSTNLPAELWCEENLFTAEAIDGGTGNRILDSSKIVVVNDRFHLTSLIN
jgi:hypothetical protein